MSKLADTFARLKKEGRAAFIPFITAGDPDMEEGAGPLGRRRERRGGAGGRLDRADPADEGGRSVGAAKLFGGRGDDEDHPSTVPRCTTRAFSPKR